MIRELEHLSHEEKQWLFGPEKTKLWADLRVAFHNMKSIYKKEKDFSPGSVVTGKRARFQKRKKVDLDRFQGRNFSL